MLELVSTQRVRSWLESRYGVSLTGVTDSEVVRRAAVILGISRADEASTTVRVAFEIARRTDEWDEGAHPRASDGRFGEGDDHAAVADKSVDRVRELKGLVRGHAEDGDMAGAHARLAELNQHIDEVTKHSDAHVAHARASGDTRKEDDASDAAVDRRMVTRGFKSEAERIIQMHQDSARGVGVKLPDRTQREKGVQSSLEYAHDANKFRASLTPDQVYAVQNYSNHTDKILNNALRSSQGRVDLDKDLYTHYASDPSSSVKRDPSQTKDTSIGREMKSLDSAIDRHRLSADVKVYRTLSDPGGLIAGRLKVGSTFTDHGYASTTGDKAVINSFYHGDKADRVDMHITVPKGSALAPIGQVSTFGGERESLLPRGTTFRVTAVSQDPKTGAKQIHVEVQ